MASLHKYPRSTHLVSHKFMLNFYSLCIVVIIACVTVDAAIDTIDHDQVVPFAQPEPVTDAQKAAVKFKPQLKISYGCHPYPAVDEDGSISSGLRWWGRASGKCKGSVLGSQVYSRSAAYDDKWAIMYAWYFPKARQDSMNFRDGHRHQWLWAVVWINNPAGNSSEVLGVSMSGRYNYQKHSSLKSKYLDGSNVKLDSYLGGSLSDRAALRLTKDDGEFQDLIQWEQLTDEARESLSAFDFDESLWNTKNTQMPLRSDIFTTKLKKSYPF